MRKCAWLLLVVMALAIQGLGEAKTSKIDSAADLKDKVIGSVSPAMPTNAVEASIAKAIGAKPKSVQFYNRYSDCVMALKAGKVDAVLSPKFEAEYYVKRNPDLKLVSREPVKVNVVMGVRAEDAQLKDELDKAIATLQGNGFLKKLAEDLVTNLPVGHEPVAQAKAEIPGAKKMFVAVCGDYVPLDYIAANGSPAGFNVALLNEIGRMLNVNFEFVSLESQARFVALKSKKVDIVFCNLDGDTPGLQALKEKSWAATKPYFSSETGGFLVKK